MPALVWFFLVLAVACADPARADVVVITYGAAGTTGVDPTALCTGATNCDYGVENFSTWSGGDFTSAFNDGIHSTTGGVSFSGTYEATGVTTTSQWVSEPANQYGGDPYPGGHYPELFGPGNVKGPTGQTQSSYTLTLSATGLPGGVKGPNYFGVWISALDQYNDMKVYDTNDVLIAQFNSTVLLAALGSCTGGHNPYCGNPLDSYADPGELFAFVNIYDLNGTIGSVQFFNSGSTGFESSNDTVAYIDPMTVNGTVLDIPEPSSLAVFAVGLLGLVGLRRRLRPRYFADCNASNI
jgi:hypothetical protein